MSHPLDQPVGARYLSWSLHSYRCVYDVSSVTTISGVCPPHRRLQFHVAFIHVSHWPHTLQCLPRNSLPSCLKNRLKRLPERGPAPLLDSNVCCDVCCSFRTTLVRSLARFQSLPRRTACRDVPSATRFLRTDHYVEIWLRLHF